MPKLRNATTDVGKFTQWLGRKCRNHNPLEELMVVNRQKLPDRHHPKTRGNLKIVADADENKLIYGAGDRFFKVTVEEIEAEEASQLQAQAVGF